MTQERSLLSDGAWLTGLQGLAALGQLAGVRLLTEILPPAVFGECSLLLGVVAFAAAGLANPTMQAMLHYYPEYVLQGKGGIVKTVVRRQLLKLVKWTLPVFLLGAAIALVLNWLSTTGIVLLIALVAVEIARMQNTALLNASREHRFYGIWATVEAWGRPILAWLLVKFLGISTTLVLVGFLMASVCTWAVMRRLVPHDNAIIDSNVEQAALFNRFWQYSLPLLPLGLLGWVSGMADRYMIGVLLSPADVGLYVAIYGLASRPMLMFGGIVETTIRPSYQCALIEGDKQRANDYLYKWTLIIVFGSLIATTIAWVGQAWLTSLFLGEQYRSASYLLPWIVGGYAFYLQYQVVGRVCYAHGATLSILLIEGFGAVLALVLGFICIKQAGLWGAAFAVSLYYGAQFISGLILSRKWFLYENIESLNRNIE
jgi:O-antigen/teichoic acid export membrane protein